MRFYRTELLADAGTSYGFLWNTTKKAADKEAAEWVEANNPGAGGRACRIDVININPTKEGIGTALRLYAAHPDNG